MQFTRRRRLLLLAAGAALIPALLLTRWARSSDHADTPQIVWVPNRKAHLYRLRLIHSARASATPAKLNTRLNTPNAYCFDVRNMIAV